MLLIRIAIKTLAKLGTLCWYTDLYLFALVASVSNPEFEIIATTPPLLVRP